MIFEPVNNIDKHEGFALFKIKIFYGIEIEKKYF